MHVTYLALHEVTCCMAVWCVQNAPRLQQFYVALAMPAKYTTSVDSQKRAKKKKKKKKKLFIHAESHASAVSLLESGK